MNLYENFTDGQRQKRRRRNLKKRCSFAYTRHRTDDIQTCYDYKQRVEIVDSLNKYWTEYLLQILTKNNTKLTWGKYAKSIWSKDLTHMKKLGRCDNVDRIQNLITLHYEQQIGILSYKTMCAYANMPARITWTLLNFPIIFEANLLALQRKGMRNGGNASSKGHCQILNQVPLKKYVFNFYFFC